MEIRIHLRNDPSIQHITNHTLHHKPQQLQQIRFTSTIHSCSHHLNRWSADHLHSQKNNRSNVTSPRHEPIQLPWWTPYRKQVQMVPPRKHHIRIYKNLHVRSNLHLGHVKLTSAHRIDILSSNQHVSISVVVPLESRQLTKRIIRLCFSNCPMFLRCCLQSRYNNFHYNCNRRICQTIRTIVRCCFVVNKSNFDSRRWPAKKRQVWGSNAPEYHSLCSSPSDDLQVKIIIFEDFIYHESNFFQTFFWPFFRSFQCFKIWFTVYFSFELAVCLLTFAFALYVLMNVSFLLPQTVKTIFQVITNRVFFHILTSVQGSNLAEVLNCFAAFFFIWCNFLTKCLISELFTYLVNSQIIIYISY